MKLEQWVEWPSGDTWVIWGSGKLVCELNCGEVSKGQCEQLQGRNGGQHEESCDLVWMSEEEGVC